MEFDMSQILRLIHSPAGKQLVEYLQKNGGDELQQAVTLASSGDISSAKKALLSVMKTPEAHVLLKQLEEMQ